jgi:SAM-dependent methyltransferase
MCRKAAAAIGQRAVVAAGEQLPFAPGSFDAVVGLGVIGYSPSPQAFLASLRQVLRPGGVLVISSASERLLLHSLSASASRWPDRCYRWAKATFTGRPLPDDSAAKGFYRSHYNYMDAREFDALLAAQGFARLGGSGVNFGELRFMGKRILSDAWAIWLTRRFTTLSRRLPFLQRFSRIYVTAVQAPAAVDGAGSERKAA